MKKIVLILVMFSYVFGNILNEADKAYAKKEYKTAIKLLQNACDKNMAVGCHNLALMYLNGSGVGVNLEKSALFFQKACDKKIAQSCQNLGLLYEKGLGVEQNYFKAVKMYKKSCDDKNLAGCENLAYMYENGLGVRQNLQKANEIYTKMCNKGNSNSCYRLYEFHNTKNKNLAFDFLDKACLTGKSDACREIGVLYTEGVFIKQNFTEAKEYFGKACDLEDMKGCESYKLLNESGF